MAGADFLNKSTAACPPDLLGRARELGPLSLLVVGAGADLPLQAALDGMDSGLARPVLIGDPDEIAASAARLNRALDGLVIIAAKGENAMAEAAVGVLAGHTDGVPAIDAVMKGHIHTDIFMAACLKKEAGLRIGARFVHIFCVFPPNGGSPVLVSDAALNVQPDIQTRQTALREMVRLAGLLDIEHPRIAILSATETAIASVPSSIEAAELASWASQTIGGAEIHGPLSLDLAVSATSVQAKGLVGHPVAGQADALLVPDLVSGNILYKSLVWFGGGCAAGLVMGARLPILLTSRADPPEARLASLALARLVG